MDELSRYIIVYYPQLMTEEERLAHRHLVTLEKIAKTDSSSRKRLMERRWLSSDSTVLQLFENGEETFFLNVSSRILTQHREQIFLNHCPKCGALAKTPKAKQCAKCYHSWHEISA